MINKTYFKETTLDAQAPEVLAWLQANATDYFDSITYDAESSVIKCSVGDKEAFSVLFSDTNRLTANLKNGAIVKAYGGSAALLQYGIATDHGIAILVQASNPTWLFITRSDSDSLIMAMMCMASSSSGTAHFYVGDFENSPAWSDVYGSSSSGDLWGKNMSISAALTTLTPIVLKDYPSYTPNLYIMRFTEYLGNVGKLIINGEEYFSNGYLALKG